MKTIRLTQGKVALVDDADYDWLNQWKWYASKGSHTFYVQRRPRINGKQPTIKMHRLILGLTDRKIEGDHIDGNGLNNQRHNLRKCTHQQNTDNRVHRKKSLSGYKGVYWDKRKKRFSVSFEHKGKVIRVGKFKIAEDAAKAYNKAVLEYKGEFARLNIF